MPLHTIPLCKFRYVRDINYSGAIFEYKKLNNILKAETKMLNRMEINSEVNKESGIILSRNNISIVIDDEKCLSHKENEISKHSFKELNIRYKELYLEQGILFSRYKGLEFTASKSIELKSKETDIFNKKISMELKIKRKELFIFRSKQVKITDNCELIKNNSLELKRKYNTINIAEPLELKRKYNTMCMSNFLQVKRQEMSMYIVEKNKDLRNLDKALELQEHKKLEKLYKELTFAECYFAQIPIRNMYVKNSIELRKKFIPLNKNMPIFFTRKELMVNLLSSFQLRKPNNKELYKKEDIKYARRQSPKEISLIWFYLLKRNINIQLEKDKSINMVTRQNLKDLNKCTLPKGLYRGISKNILKDFSIKITNKNNLKKMIKGNISIGLVRFVNERISKILHQVSLYRVMNTKITLRVISHYLYKLKINHVFKIQDNKYMKKLIARKIVSTYSLLGLTQNTYTVIFKPISKYVDKDGETRIYRDVGKTLNRIIDTDIAKPKELYLKSCDNEQIFLNSSNKFIDVVKRWWWLNPTEPTDSIIIPNKDFSYNQELLNNPEYEYLRFTNHPMGWGDTWGIDWNIPAYAVSIEIMLDLVNILIMVWHSNVQGWLCSTGRESMQFMMELFYDWYTLDTSTPNADYYRAYRWIRWEAEKVYFLNLEDGLQAVGVLIANLIDYLKLHHFNIVPLWRNPKAMDIERNFNRVAQNGDLMKVLDKIKGKRYYYIETQNIEKKNIFGGD